MVAYGGCDALEINSVSIVDRHNEAWTKRMSGHGTNGKDHNRDIIISKAVLRMHN